MVLVLRRRRRTRRLAELRRFAAAQRWRPVGDDLAPLLLSVLPELSRRDSVQPELVLSGTFEARGAHLASVLARPAAGRRGRGPDEAVLLVRVELLRRGAVEDPVVLEEGVGGLPGRVPRVVQLGADLVLVQEFREGVDLSALLRRLVQLDEGPAAGPG
ncbi:hypothetical protein NUM3379_18040 [Kineococcus sp. NUM-3379]